MWRILLRIIPLDQLIVLVGEFLTGLSDKIFGELWKVIVHYVEEAEKKYGSGKGKEKFEYVKRKVEEVYPTLRTWIINFLIEMAVAYLKTRGVIQ